MGEHQPTNGAPVAPLHEPVSLLSGLVSILVPCCGQLEYTKLCVESVLRYSREPFELIFIDIGSLDGTAAYLAGIKAAARAHVEVVRAETDLGIGEAVKEALRRNKGAYVVLLNNDTVVSNSWLNQLIGLASLRADIGLVGPMSNYAAPPQLVESVPYRIATRGGASSHGLLDVEPVQAFAGEWRDKQRGKWIEVDRLGGFCLLIKRQVLAKIGRDLDKWTDLGLFDTDILSAKARQAGFTLACCRDMFVHHFGTRSFAHGAPASATGQGAERR
jgi:O-antigen biosynthesis protein